VSRLFLSGLHLYPVKSLRGCAVMTAEVDAFGLAGDRRFLVVDPTGRFLTQRSLPRMALINTRLEAAHLVLSAPGLPDLQVPRSSDPSSPLRRVTVWKHEGLAAEDCGQEAAAWLTGFLGVDCGLVRQGREYERQVLKSAARPGDAVSFADSCPFLLVGESSLAGLNDRLLARGEEPVPMNRFRPNLVFTGGAPHVEDGWRALRIGPVPFRSAGPCARCIVVTTDQATSARHAEPLHTLGGYRRDSRDPTQVNFGLNLIQVTKAGTLSVGDPVVPDSVA
jgi:uncharacterized protein YcbX